MADPRDDRCIPCIAGVAALRGAELTRRHERLGKSWRLIDERRLEKDFRFRDFLGALAFTNRIGAVAERRGHHPVVHLSWGKVRLSLWTHKSQGLTEDDFRLAMDADHAYATSGEPTNGEGAR